MQQECSRRLTPFTPISTFTFEREEEDELAYLDAFFERNEDGRLQRSAFRKKTKSG